MRVPPLRPTFYSTLPHSIRSYHPTDSATRNRGTIPQTFSPRKRNSIDKTAGAPSLLRMILTRGTKCTAVIKSDLPALPFLLSPLFSCRLTVVPFAHFDRENSEVVTPSRDSTFSPFFPPLRSYYPYLTPLPGPRLRFLIFFFPSVCSNNRVIPRVIRELSRLFRSDCSTIVDRSSGAIFFPPSSSSSPFASCARAITVQTVSFSDYYHTRLEFGNRVHDLSGRK